MEERNAKKLIRIVVTIIVVTVSGYKSWSQTAWYDHCKIYDTKYKKTISVADLVQLAGNANVLFFGEEYNNSIAHRLQDTPTLCYSRYETAFRNVQESREIKKAVAALDKSIDSAAIKNMIVAGQINFISFAPFCIPFYRNNPCCKEPGNILTKAGLENFVSKHPFLSFKKKCLIV